MHRRRLFSLICAAAAALVALGGSNRAEADVALRLVASGPGPDQAFFLNITPGDPLNETFSKNLTIGSYTLVATLQTTNFPGTAATGSLSLQVTTSTGGTAPAALTLTGSVINSTGLSGASTVAQIEAASLASFTLPAGTANSLTLGNSAVANGTVTSGSLTGTAFYNGANVLSFGGALTGFSQTKTVGGLSPSPYTLAVSQLISGLNANVSGAVTQSTISISTPEPGTIAMALTALPLLGLGTMIRRRRARS